MPEPITQQDTYDHIFGSGFDMYGWWGIIRPEWDQREPAPHGWSVLVSVETGDHVWRDILVTHSVILSAMRKLATGDVKYATDSVAEACRDFLNDPEDADFDAGTADEVMQMATLGEVVYG
ncbi:hypothetical protein [Streptomyces ardesiacus]|uniref:hypothetical protein n=1 Tax=Streptomyces ardesiacus TaxID=285564 RepID=UPI0038095652